MNLMPGRLPDREALKTRTKAIAMLDAIMGGGDYSFDNYWDKDEQMASMKTGYGEEWYILFAPFGVGIKGLDHQTLMAGDKNFKSKIERELPESFLPFYSEPAFSWDWVSFCYWLEPHSSAWGKVEPDYERYTEDTNDGSERLLKILLGDEDIYRNYAVVLGDYLIPLEPVKLIYKLEPLTVEMVESLNENMSWEAVVEQAKEINYPVSS